MDVQRGLLDLPDARAKDAPDVLAVLRAYDAAWYRHYWAQRALQADRAGMADYAAYCRAQMKAWEGSNHDTTTRSC